MATNLPFGSCSLMCSLLNIRRQRREPRAREKINRVSGPAIRNAKFIRKTLIAKN